MSPAMSHNAPMQPLVFRSTVARVVAWIFVAFAALNLIDVVIRGRGQSGRVAFAVLVAIALIAYVLGLRPGVVADSQQVQLRNPLRDVSVPWNAVTAIDSTDVLRIHAGPAVFRSWAIAAGNRARRRALGRQSAPQAAARPARTHGWPNACGLRRRSAHAGVEVTSGRRCGRATDQLVVAGHRLPGRGGAADSGTVLLG